MATGQGDDDWALEARCLGLPTEWWFPEQGQTKYLQKAQAECTQCPVAVDCIMWAIEAFEDDGIWGGAGKVTIRELRKSYLANRRSNRCRGEGQCTCEFCGMMRQHMARMRGDKSVPPIKAPVYTHGYSGYNRGCRCTILDRVNNCTDGHAEYLRNYKAAGNG